MESISMLGESITSPLEVSFQHEAPMTQTDSRYYRSCNYHRCQRAFADFYSCPLTTSLSELGVPFSPASKIIINYSNWFLAV
jgi:hypothetical protein